MAKKRTLPSSEYWAWQSIKKRCYYTQGKQYDDYGGRGIRVCDRWLHSFDNFIADMGMKPTSKHTIEREDNDGDYTPTNCRWATRQEQARNKRNNRLLSYGGVTKTAAQWNEEKGFSRNLLRDRLRWGWTIEQAMETSTVPPGCRRDSLDDAGVLKIFQLRATGITMKSIACQMGTKWRTVSYILRREKRCNVEVPKELIEAAQSIISVRHGRIITKTA